MVYKIIWREKMTNEQIIQTWMKGAIAPTNSPNMWRKDVCGAWMKFTDYGNRNSQYGWEIDHIKPGSDDNPANLQPLHWGNNAAKSDGRQVCIVTAYGVNNVRTQLQ